MLPFRKTLTFKLFVSYCLVVLVTILTTFAVHTIGFRLHIASVFKQESELLAQELRPEAEKYLAEGQSESLDEFLKLAQASARYGVNFVSFEAERSDSRPSFLLTAGEQASVSSGESIDGSATGRIDLDGFRSPPPSRRGLKGAWKGRKPNGRRGRGGGRGPRLGPGPPSSSHEPSQFVAVPLNHGGKVVGALVVYDTKPGFSRMSQMLLGIVGKGLLVALFPALLAALIFSRNLTRPIRRMEVVASEYSGGDFSTRTNLQRDDEMGVLAKAFDNMASELEENIATRERLLSDVSHELGTPITTIRATLEAILDRIVEPGQTDFYLESSLGELEHLSRIVKDITELSRFETGEIRIEQGVFLAEVPVQKSVEAAIILAKRKNIEINVIESEKGLQVRGDLHRITQVLKNLVTNAVQHNPEGTIVRAFWTEESDSVVFTVQDNGHQISGSDAKKIFERFYKVSESRTRDESSSGLGLAIVTRILQGHGTKISVESTDDGKLFRFSLSKA